LIDIKVEIHASLVNHRANIIFQIEPRHAFRAIHSLILLALHIEPHRRRDTVPILEYVILLACQAIAVIGVIGLAVSGDLIACALSGIEAVITETAKGRIGCELTERNVVIVGFHAFVVKAFAS
jgi:uncharacterized membrane protein YgdD (TMEM256/DUF423 family)